jgi:hypothetical protein
MPPKKAAKPHDEKHHEAKDLRRAYEHRGRVEILQRVLQPIPAEEVSILAALAQQELQNGLKKDAADLLRGAEHLSFAALAGESVKRSQVSKDLEQAIIAEFEHLTNKATEHWEYEGERDKAVTAIYRNARKNAKEAIEKRAYHQALEFARAVEALTHTKQHRPQSIESAKEHLKLSSS